MRRISLLMQSPNPLSLPIAKRQVGQTQKEWPFDLDDFRFNAVFLTVRSVNNQHRYIFFVELQDALCASLVTLAFPTPSPTPHTLNSGQHFVIS